MNLLHWIVVLFFVTLIWFLPIYVAHQIGESKNRAGWAWGLFLGWLGVIVVALLPQSTRVGPPPTAANAPPPATESLWDRVLRAFDD